LSEGNLNLQIKKKKCNYLLYKYDDNNILRGLKGGLFPFFNDAKGVQKRPDFIMFVEQGTRFYVFIIEIKEKKLKPIKQIKAGECFVYFIIKTINRIENINLDPQIRGIGISAYNTLKRNTKVALVQYDDNNYYDYKYNNFFIDLLLN
jgi:hypothetical protein